MIDPLEYDRMAYWDEKVAPRLSRIRQSCFWIRKEVQEILHAIRMMEMLPEWETEAAHQLNGTIHELEAALSRLQEAKEAMAEKRGKEKKSNAKHSRKLA